MNTKDYLSVKQYAISKNLSHQRLYKLIQQGRVNYTTIANTKFIHKDAKILKGRLKEKV